MNAASLDAMTADLAVLCKNQAHAEPVRWMILCAGRTQLLLVPAEDLRAAMEAINFFIGRRLLRVWLRARLLLESCRPRARRLARIELQWFPAETIFNDGDQPDCAARHRSLALLYGSPGPLQKVVLLRMGQAVEDMRVAKLALRASADHSIERESYWLSILNRSPATAPFVPRLLRSGALACGRRFIVMNALPKGRPGQRYDARHRNFLAALGASGRTIAPWAVSVPTLRLQVRCRALSPSLEIAWRSLFEETLRDIDLKIGSLSLPACLAHGDFAPWNIRVANGRLFVFDWEYAQECASPLHDYLHFHLISHIAAKGLPDLRFVQRLLARAADHGDALFGADSGVGRACGALLAHYLLDTVSFYAHESGYLDTDHHILRPYLRLLAERAAWLRPEPSRSTFAPCRHDHARGV